MNKFLRTIAACALTLCTTAAFAQDDSEITVVFQADFTTVTEGTPENPVAFASYGTGSFSSFFPSWQQSKVMQAGGQILIQDGGYIRTPSGNLSANNGTSRITTRVKMMDATGGCIKFSVGYSTTETLIITDDEWHNVEVILGGGTSYSYVRIEPFLSASGILVKNVEVAQSPNFIAAPAVEQPTQADGTSFTARWKSVKGATGYLLDVYSYEADGAKAYVLENQEVAAGTLTYMSYEVTGLDPAKTYYYTVRATNGVGVSSYSEEIKVVKVIYYLSKPADVTVTPTADSFSATWGAVEDAQWYNVNVMATRTLTEAEDVTLIDEDFAKITSGAFDGIDFIVNPNIDPYTQTPGWEGTELGKAVGMMVITPLSGATGYLNTPILDLSSSDGAFTVSINMAEGAYGSFYSGDEAKIYVVDSEGNELSSQTITLENGFKDYEIAMTGGTANCRVGISYGGSRKIFIESFKVVQAKPAGSAITTLFCEEETTETSFSKTVENPDANTVYTLTVIAGAETVRGGYLEPIYSEVSDAVEFKVGVQVGIDETVVSGDSAPRYFNLQGVEVAPESLGKGIYLKVENGKTVKILNK